MHFTIKNINYVSFEKKTQLRINQNYFILKYYVKIIAEWKH